MKIAVLGDIHSNYPAFLACVREMESREVDRFLFLGDYVSDCADPQLTMDLLYLLEEKYPCDYLIGNREEYMLNHHQYANDGWFAPSSASGSLLYTYQHLREKDFAFFASHSISGRIALPGCPAFLCCHGTMQESRGKLELGSDYARATLDAMEEDLLVCGHNHTQGIMYHGGKTLMNVGSVGIPWHHGGKSQCGMLTLVDGYWRAECLQIAYDTQQTIERIRGSELAAWAPIWSKIVEYTLQTGVDYSMPCLELAMDKCQRAQGDVNWPMIPERFWEEAAAELGIY